MAMSVDLHDAVCTVCVNQISNLDSEVDYLASSEADAEAAARSTVVPVTGESFCQCPQEEPGPGVGLLGFSTVSDCLCGEEDQGESG